MPLSRLKPRVKTKIFLILHCLVAQKKKVNNEMTSREQVFLKEQITVTTVPYQLGCVLVKKLAWVKNHNGQSKNQ